MRPILLVENSPARIAVFEEWVPEGFRLVPVTTGNVALGVLRRDAGSVYAGVMLDFDLDKVSGCEMRTGRTAAEAVIRYVDKGVPILIHSMNPAGASEMRTLLSEAGFDTTRVPFSKLSERRFLEWVSELES